MKTILSLNPSKILSQEFFINNLSIILNELELKSTMSKEKEKFVLALEHLKTFRNIENKPLLFSDSKEEKKEEKKELKKQETLFEDINIVESFRIENKKVSVDDFVKYFRNRYNTLKLFLQEQELKNLTSINKIPGQRQNLSVIGMVFDKHTTKNKNIILEVEDLTGRIKVLIRHDKEELLKKAEQIVLDEVIAVSGTSSNEILFANDIIFPEIILPERKKSKEESYAAFIADLHVGSNKFLEQNFLKFIDWINGKTGSEGQKNIAKKVRYLFIVGDLVDGVGIYPGQESELIIKDVYLQYDKVAELLSKIRKDVAIIICPGNHDAVRIVEPQPPFSHEIAKKLYDLPNVIVLTNPSSVNIGVSKQFQGFNVFMYHGASFDEYGNDVEVLRLNQAFKRPELILHFLMRKRHVAPTHASTRYFPCDRDSLILRKVPDIFVTAHLHKSSISYYNNIVAISCSCWQSRTAYQEKFGHEPDLCKVPLFNLKTGKINIIDFN